MKIHFVERYYNKSDKYNLKSSPITGPAIFVAPEEPKKVNSLEILPYISSYKNINFHNEAVSFGAMKKNQFSGVDRLVVEKYTAPIEKFNTIADFQSWCRIKLYEQLEEDIISNDPQTTAEREKGLNEWMNYISVDAEKYPSSVCLLIFDSLIKSLKGKSDSLLPVFDKDALNAVIYDIEQHTYKQFNFNKEYFLQLQKKIIKQFALDNDRLEGWLIIPSESNDPDNFENNTKYLKALSADTWCTRGCTANGYLSRGDFHIYFENSEPVLGIRFESANVVEIQDETNSSKIPLKYLDIAIKHLSDTYLLCEEAYETMDEAVNLKKAIDNLIAEKFDGKNPSDFSAEEIFEKCGITLKKDEDGFYTFSNYSIAGGKITFADLGINENKKFGKILKRLKAIDGDANFSNTNMQELPYLETIGGDMLLYRSQIQSLPVLKFVGGSINAMESCLETMPNLREVGRHAYLNNGKIKDLPLLEIIKGNAIFSQLDVTSLPNLREIGESACFSRSRIRKMEKLEKIGKDAFFRSSEIEELPMLKTIGGDADFMSTPIKILPVLETIGEKADFRECEDVLLPKLRSCKSILGGNCIANIDELEDVLGIQAEN